mmetsp:Transcript_59228/g.157662  ORF Transcript_59228/g.157662 Transcript_59228/m.157662 type:complete len:241 (-) Transcript_59228:312-1034(-)
MHRYDVNDVYSTDVHAVRAEAAYGANTARGTYPILEALRRQRDSSTWIIKTTVSQDLSAPPRLKRIDRGVQKADMCLDNDGEHEEPEALKEGGAQVGQYDREVTNDVAERVEGSPLKVVSPHRQWRRPNVCSDDHHDVSPRAHDESEHDNDNVNSPLDIRLDTSAALYHDSSVVDAALRRLKRERTGEVGHPSKEEPQHPQQWYRLDQGNHGKFKPEGLHRKRHSNVHLMEDARQSETRK